MDDRLEQLKHWLDHQLGLSGYQLEPASSDASFRRYFRLSLDSSTSIVMDAPPEQENCSTFLDITQRLAASGLNVPSVKAQDLEQGFLLLKDLGAELFLDRLSADTADQLYGDAIDALLTMQQHTELDNLPLYDETLMRQEMSLFGDWLMDRHLRLPESLIASLDDVQDFLLEECLAQTTTFVHRDFHSRNLMVCDDNPGIIDYQDAVVGPYTYDLVSLLKDSYIKWPASSVTQWLKQFHDKRCALDTDTPPWSQFRRDLDLMGVQRQLKIGGIFARLYHRDGKAGYLEDIPNTLTYITELDNGYPELEELIQLLRTRILPALRGAT